MTAERLYLDLLKKVLSRTLWDEDTLVPAEIPDTGGLSTRLGLRWASWVLQRNGLEVVTRIRFDREASERGRYVPKSGAETMIGLRRLDNLQECVETVISDRIPGDLIETGVWRGGAAILMRAVLRAYQVKDRKVWCADSFEGLPAPNVAVYPHDAPSTWHTMPELAISVDTVKQNFTRYGLLDEQVVFLEGWFRDTLPSAPIAKLAVVRLDGDLYESTMDALTHLYPKLSPGGFLIIDDYGIPQDMCRRAVQDFRNAQNITEKIVDIDGWGVYWRRMGA